MSRKPVLALAIYDLMREGLRAKEIKDRLGLDWPMTRSMMYYVRKKRDYFDKICPNCYEPAVLNDVCGNCGYTIFDIFDINVGVKVERADEAQAGSLMRDGNGLGTPVSMNSKLISYFRQRQKNKFALTQGIYGYDEPALTRAVLQKVRYLANFRDRDFQATEEAGRLARKICSDTLKSRITITKSLVEDIVISVLAECYDSFGPNRVRIYDERVKQKVLSLLQKKQPQ